jgi:anti-sigma factor RsiW
MLTCRQVSELATDYLDGQLSLLARLRFRRHLRRCPPCACFVEQLDTTVKLLGGLPHEPLCPETRAKLMRCYKDWKQSQQ